MIDKDLPRTFINLAFFHNGGPLETQLRDVLEAYVFYRPDVGCELPPLPPPPPHLLPTHSGGPFRRASAWDAVEARWWWWGLLPHPSWVRPPLFRL